MIRLHPPAERPIHLTRVYARPSAIVLCGLQLSDANPAKSIQLCGSGSLPIVFQEHQNRSFRDHRYRWFAAARIQAIPPGVVDVLSSRTG